MNYFELFGIPVSFCIDRTQLSKQLFGLQKKYHPDYYGQGTDEDKQEALTMSSMANMAFATLRSEEATVKYVLQLHGMLEDNEKYELPQDFLMEVMNLNELKMDGEPDEVINQQVMSLQKEIRQMVQPILDKTNASVDEADLLKVKEWYYKKKYLDRLLAD